LLSRNEQKTLQQLEPMVVGRNVRLDPVVHVLEFFHRGSCESHELLQIVPDTQNCGCSDPDESDYEEAAIVAFFERVERRRHRLSPKATEQVGSAFLGAPQSSRLLQRRKKAWCELVLAVSDCSAG